MLKVLILITFFSILALAQDSPMQSAPGSGPPPQGWNPDTQPNGGIHLPAKKNKKNYKLKMGPPKASATPAK